MPLYLYFSFLLCLWLGNANVLCLFLIFFIFSTLPESRFRQCPMPLYLTFSFLLCLFLGFANVLCLFIYIFLLFCVSGSVLPNVLCFFIFIFLCLCLCFANVLCLFICISSFVPVAWFCQCSIIFIDFFLFISCALVLPMFYASLLYFFFSFVSVSLFCQRIMSLCLDCFSFLLCLWLGFANVLCLFIFLFFYFVSVARIIQCFMHLYL